jgi:tetratricopeptide (TPR) repeat protein
MKNAIKLLVLACLATLISVQPPLRGAITGAVEGVVKDATTGQVLEGVKVTIVSTKTESMRYEAFTDKKGHFYRGGLVTGPYKVTMEKEGYLPQEGTIRVNIDQTAQLNVPLSPAQGAAPMVPATVKSLTAGSDLLSAGKYEEAIAKFSEVIGQAPTNPVAFFYRAAAYEKIGNNDKAIEDYGKAIEQKPDFALSYARSGIILAKKGDFEKAIGFYKKAVELGDNDPSTHYNFGVCLVNVGKSEEAKAVFEKVLTLDPNYSDAFYQLGIIAVGAGDSAKAKEYLEKFIALDPENKNVALAKEILKSLN